MMARGWKRAGVCWAFAFASALGAAAAEARHTLARGGLVVVVATDTERMEKHHGPRFDRTAQVVSVTIDGRELLAEGGLVDEFAHKGEGLPGFVSGSEAFVKPGVGLLRKASADGPGDYRFDAPHEVLARGEVVVSVSATELTARQFMPSADGVALELEKTYSLGAIPGELLVAWRLRNPGERPYRSDHYNHHFFRFAGAEPGPGYVVRPRGVPQGPPRLVRGFDVKPGEWRLAVVPTATRAAYVGFSRADACEGVEAPAAGFVLEHRAGGRVDFDAGLAAELICAWAGPEGVCPEVFVRVEAPAGGEARWTQTYRFTPR
jgi:hypothetical protein